MKKRDGLLYMSYCFAIFPLLGVCDRRRLRGDWMYVPSELDGAKVILHTDNKKSNDYGFVIYEDHEEVVTALAIAKYDNDENYYLFDCNLDWEVIGDTLHSAIDDAKSCAEISKKLDVIIWYKY
jgi:hypothetical protein